MTRAEVLARYGPIRAGIRRVLREAAEACGRADLNWAVKEVAPWALQRRCAPLSEALADIEHAGPRQPDLRRDRVVG